MEFVLKQRGTGTETPGLKSEAMLTPVRRLVSGWVGGPIDLCWDVFLLSFFFFLQHLADVIRIFEMCVEARPLLLSKHPFIFFCFIHFLNQFSSWQELQSPDIHIQKQNS